MEIIQLDIVAIRASDTQNNAYVLLLKELRGSRQLPVVIGWCEARSIAIALDGTEENERPLTHDLFKVMTKEHDITVTKIIIHSLKDGIFHSSFYCKSQTHGEIEIDARTSDAIALALRFSCPIFTYEKILDKAGVLVRKNKKYENQKTSEKTIQKKHEKTYGEMRLSELKKLLKKAIQSENYEKASKIRDEINKRGNN